MVPKRKSDLKEKLTMFGMIPCSQFPLYLSEMAPPKYRGALNNAFEVFVGIGIFMANLINFFTQKIKPGWGWRLSLSLAAVPAIPLTIGAIFLPETPNSIIQRRPDQPNAAKKLLQKIRATDDVDAEFDDIVKASINISSKNHGVAAIMRRKNNRPQLVMAVLIPFFQQLTGINVVTFYVPVIFRTVGLGESTALMSTVLTGLVSTGSVAAAMVTVDRAGRRRLFVVGGVLMIVSPLVVGGVMASVLKEHGGMSKGYAYVVLVVICVYCAGFGVSWGPLGWLIPSEIFPLEMRSVGQSMVVAVGFVFTFVIAQSFLAMLCHMKWGIFFFFGGWVVVMTVFAFLPETKGVRRWMLFGGAIGSGRTLLEMKA